MKQTLITLAVVAVATAMAGAASAQTMPHRDDPAWEVIGTTADGTRYSIIPAEVSREHTTVWLILKATVAPSSSGSPNTVVAAAMVECRVPTIVVGKSEFYNETQGFLRTVEPTTYPVPQPATDPGQLLVIRHVCVADES